MLADEGKLDEALANFEKALSLRPHSAEIHVNMGNAFGDQGKMEEALACYRQALILKPDCAEAHFNRSCLWLRHGHWEQGWEEYEWRWLCKDYPRPAYPQPLWDGSPLPGLTLLLFMEQGLGDMLQFIRYAPLVKQRGPTVIVECPGGLSRFMARCPGIDQLVPRGHALPDFDVQASLLSLPAIFRSTPQTLPAAVPYLFADAALIDKWRHELSSVEGFKIGIHWQGNPRYSRDRQRSIPLACFEPLARLEGVPPAQPAKGSRSRTACRGGGSFSRARPGQPAG